MLWIVFDYPFFAYVWYYSFQLAPNVAYNWFCPGVSLIVYLFHGPGEFLPGCIFAQLVLSPVPNAVALLVLVVGKLYYVELEHLDCGPNLDSVPNLYDNIDCCNVAAEW